MRACIRAVVVVAVVAGLPWVAPGAAQAQWGGLKFEGEAEVGVRFLPNEPSNDERAKFEEYRDITQGLFLPNLRLRVFTEDAAYSAELSGAKWGQDDQEFGLRAGRIGRWDFGFDWIQTPHLFSTTGRALWTETSPGTYTLPTPRPNLNLWNTAPGIDEIGLRWDTANMFLRLTPAPDLDLGVRYMRIHKDGTSPYAMAFGSPGGNFLELVRPIDQLIHDFRIGGTWAKENWQLKFEYLFSYFDNSNKALVADNPCFGLTAAVAAGGCASAATVPRTGLLSLDPDNMAHTISLSGGVNLPYRTRITAAAAYSLRLQNDSFLPHTVNQALASAPSLALPQGDLDGRVGIFLFNASATSRPLPLPLTFTAKYRIYDHNDMSDEILFHGHTVNDASLVVEDRIAGRYSYTKQNAEADARWRFGPQAALVVGGGWERWDRNSHREVQDSNEYFAKAALDLNPLDWLSARLTYKPSFRRIGDYETFAHLTHTVVEDITPSEFAQGQSVLLRKFDEADRNRQRADLLVQVFPVERLTTSLSFGYRYDDYYNSTLGLQSGEGYTIGLDLSWNPIDRLSLYAGYVHDRLKQKMRSRSRPVTGTTTFDYPDYDWISKIGDTTDSAYAGLRLAIIPKRLDWSLDASYHYGYGAVNDSNPVPPTSGTAAQDTTATAKVFPPSKDELFRLDTKLRYSFAKYWFATLGYAFEKFRESDWRSDNLVPFTPAFGSSLWMGNDPRDYAAHIVTATLGFRFP